MPEDPSKILVARLREVVTIQERVGHRHSWERFALEHRRRFLADGCPRIFDAEYRRPNACFANCLSLARAEGRRYVEGIAVISETWHEAHHAWLLDEGDRAVDPTWTNPGQLYFGVVFDTAYAGMRYDRQVADGIVGSLLMEGDDDYALIRGVEGRKWRGRTSRHPDDLHRAPPAKPSQVWTLR